ncbi:hypothetical protein [Cohnella cellulosilytica]|uniref:Helix-turn-helix domain-containing protein n=1 Tax=Cohnella cellulosilytica TaxID=986710 RepID=A0ABW2FFU4_9BACL
MTTTEARRQAKELALEVLGKPDHEIVSVNARTIKGLMHLMRDYAVLTHATDPETEVAEAVERLINLIDLNESSTPQQTSDYYKTSQLADYFGVSVTAINNWIDEGRFIGYRREPRKHAKIPHNTPFQHRDGRIEPLGHVIERCLKQENESFASYDEKMMLLNEIETLRQKYGGRAYEDIFNLDDPSPEQEQDASRWRFYRMRLDDLS